ncbi:MAG TPA: class I SAM-dependent methyltransferase, partial [Ktedonobacterales bacterium]
WMDDPAYAPVSYTFDPFARHPFYRTVNQSLVSAALAHLDTATPKGQCVTVVDLAAGTGAVTALILDELERLDRPSEVIAVEPADTAIAIAREKLTSRNVRFIHGDAEQLAAWDGMLDAVFFCNAIHLLLNKSEAMAGVAGALKPGGIFACNSAFYHGSYVPSTAQFARLWMLTARRWLNEKHPEARPQGRDRETAIGQQWLSPANYAELFASAGLSTLESHEEEVMVPVRAMQDICHYPLFIEGVLPGVSVEIAAEALAHGAAEAAKKLNTDQAPRMWLQLIARRDAEKD